MDWMDRRVDNWARKMGVRFCKALSEGEQHFGHVLIQKQNSGPVIKLMCLIAVLSSLLASVTFRPLYTALDYAPSEGSRLHMAIAAGSLVPGDLFRLLCALSFLASLTSLLDALLLAGLLLMQTAESAKDGHEYDVLKREAAGSVVFLFRWAVRGFFYSVFFALAAVLCASLAFTQLLAGIAVLVAALVCTYHFVLTCALTSIAQENGARIPGKKLVSTALTPAVLQEFVQGLAALSEELDQEGLRTLRIVSNTILELSKNSYNLAALTPELLASMVHLASLPLPPSHTGAASRLLHTAASAILLLPPGSKVDLDLLLKTWDLYPSPAPETGGFSVRVAVVRMLRNLDRLAYHEGSVETACLTFFSSTRSHQLIEMLNTLVEAGEPDPPASEALLEGLVEGVRIGFVTQEDALELAAKHTKLRNHTAMVAHIVFAGYHHRHRGDAIK